MGDVDDLFERTDKSYTVRLTDEQGQQLYEDAKDAIDNDEDEMMVRFKARPSHVIDQLQRKGFI